MLKRTLFYIIFAGCVIGSTCVVLFVGGFMPTGSGFATGNDLVHNMISGIINGKYKFGSTPLHFHTYAMFLFLVLNAGVLITMLLLWLTSGFNLNRIKRFYRISIWFLISSLLLTASWVWVQIDTSNKGFGDSLKALFGIAIIPVVSSLLATILGLVLSFGRQ